MPRFCGLLLCVGVLLSSCQVAGIDEPEETTEGRLSGDIPELEQFPGLLTEATTPSDEHQRPPVAEAYPLDPAVIQQLLSRLDPLPKDADDEQAFALREATDPPPRRDSVIQSPFPPDDQQRAQQGETPKGSLQLLRYSPQGEVDMAGRISLTFDRPMVELGTQEQVISQSLPVRLQPAVAGQWRWVGTRTLMFQPEAARLPMATEYTVTVEAGTQAADGSVLDEAKSWQFSTSPLEVARMSPLGNSVEREPLIVLRFNQRIEQEAIVEKLRLRADQQTLAFEAVDAEVLADDPDWQRELGRLEEGRWLAIKPTDPLPLDSRITVTLPSGAPSAEGPLLSRQSASRSFHTHGPLQLIGAGCGYRGHGNCRPFESIELQFSNPLAEDQDFASLITLQPEVPQLMIERSDPDRIRLDGLTRGGRSYEISVAASLQDQFGQSMNEEASTTVNVGHADARVLSQYEPMVTLEPAGSGAFDVFSVNYKTLRVRVLKVQSSDWPAFADWRRDHRNREPEDRTELPGETVLDGDVPISAEMDELLRTPIDLRKYLDEQSHGEFIVVVDGGETMSGSQPARYQPLLTHWVQLTDVALDMAIDSEKTLVWVTDLMDGAPLSGFSVRLGADGPEAISDDDGLATLTGGDVDQSVVVSASKGSRAASLYSSIYSITFQPRRLRSGRDRHAWMVADDRGIYRPGERVHVFGWLRQLVATPDGGLALPDAKTQIRYAVTDSRNNPITEGETSFSEQGGFNLAFDLSDTVNAGGATIALELIDGSDRGASFRHHFQIEEFRTPEFEVSTSLPDKTYLMDDRATVSVAANYYAGGPLPDAQVRWLVSAERGVYTPPNRSDWSFGVEQPRTWFRFPPDRSGPITDHFDSRTDSGGSHHLAIEFDHSGGLPLSFTAQGTVEDFNRQAWSSSSRFLVHPAEQYIGLRSDAYFVERGEPLTIELLSTNIAGEAMPGSTVSVEAAPLRYQWLDGEHKITVGTVQHCATQTDADGLGECVFSTEVGGQYRITAEVVDEQGRRNLSRITRWVSGGAMPSRPGVNIQDVTLIPEQEDLAPGDTARILVQAPFENAEGLLTLRRHGIAEQHRFSIQGSTTTLDVPIRAEWLPNIRAHVLLLGQTTRDGDEQGRLPPRPALAVGTLDLVVSTKEQVLDLALQTDRSQYSPGDTVELQAVVRNADGTPSAGAQLALVVVDEAVLALTDYQLKDPITIFFAARQPEVADFHLRSTLRLDDPGALETLVGQGLLGESVVQRERAVPMMMAEMSGDELSRLQTTGSRIRPEDMAVPDSEQIDVRSDYSPLAAFLPDLTTDDQGRVVTEFELPDNLSRYRIMAVAVSGEERFGKAESTFTARLPLMVRPSPPRFLNFGDTLEFPVLVQNQTDSAMQVRVALATSNLALTASQGLGVEVPANDRVELRFPAAAEQAGTARYQLAVAAEGFADAARGEFPVWTPATGEAFATYGEIDDGGMVYPVSLPEAVWPQFGQLEVTTSSTAVHSLTDAYLYLQEYPFACSEQMASRILGTTALHDVLQAFEAADLPSAEQVDQAMVRDIDALASLQGRDGGFPLWRRHGQDWPYATVHVTHALLRARDAGYSVPPQMLERSLSYLQNIERHLPDRYTDKARWHIQAYSLYVRALAEPDQALLEPARALLKQADSLDALTFESIGWLISVFSQHDAQAAELTDLHRYLANHSSETAATASFGRDFEQGGYWVMHSSRRGDAVLLDALLQDQPDSDLITKLVRGLQAHRSMGRWRNTQENAFVLLALRRYFDAFESVTPDFVARTWLGDQFAGEHTFSGRSTEAQQLDVPMQWLLEQEDNIDLQLQKDGPGRLYYRLGLRYAPKSLELEPASHGFEVQREYRALDQIDDVQQLVDGSWQIRAGARVAVDITLVVPSRRYHVALVDPLPAGLEPINPALAVSEQIRDGGAPDSSDSGWWWHRWYQHQNLRDERAEAFTTLLPGGVYHYSYHTRATTPGDFVAPPARAEEMYHPETFGRSATARVRVVD